MDIFDNNIKEHMKIVQSLSRVKEQVDRLCAKAVFAIKNNNKIILMGNGGSAADCQHFAAELVVRYKQNRKALPALALSTDTSILTAVSNDFTFDEIFSRQVEALAVKGDLVIGISTSGNSENVLKGIVKARELGCLTAALLGNRGGSIGSIVDLPIIVDSESTPRIQECHQIIIHSVCEIIEREFTNG